MKLNLEGKCALVTGSSKGIGKAICEGLEQEGVVVMGVCRGTGYDLTKEKDIEKAKRLIEYCDILINNVGGGGSWSYDMYKEVMQKNYGIMVDLTMKYLEKKRDLGRVITISSIYGKEKGHNPIFTAAKSAQIAYMKSLAGKYNGITFNVVAPGFINTKETIINDAKKYNAPLGDVNDIANAVVFLCSEKAKFINGSCLVIDGGYTKSF